jgi:hypothetical protein
MPRTKKWRLPASCAILLLEKFFEHRHQLFVSEWFFEQGSDP